MNEWTHCNIFVNNIKPLQILSRDDSNTDNIHYMIDSQISAIDFDKVKEIYAKGLGISQTPTSIDAILPLEDRFIFIEFKNGKISNEEKRNIKSKIKDSLLIFCDIVNCNINATRQFVDFILVYNGEKNPSSSPLSYNAIVNNIGQLANCRKVSFGLEQFRKLYFHSIYTFNENEFKDYLKTL